ncbi:HAD family hydrolase [Candidatus Avelusimicrobium stercoris]|uniref:HAD family hydrolase n=1 Tax=Candidatus Avelusimicrobium stercoris TaxID=1947924 RepID=UPI000EDD88AA|nr:HAD family hydrolase [Elusimicrobiota bacterium]
MTFNPQAVRFVCFDADDTLWKNEEFYRETEDKFYALFDGKLTAKQAGEALFKTEMGNLETFGYGAKSFTLSMIETALANLDNEEAARAAREILQLGKALINRPVTLLPGTQETLRALHGKYHLSVVTKGDLLDQQRKLKNSGLLPLFDHIEILTEKTHQAYLDLFACLNAQPNEVLMVGNSLRSDIFPALEAGAQAAYMPCAFTWQHEARTEPENPPYLQINTLTDILPVLL